MFTDFASRRAVLLPGLLMAVLSCGLACAHTPPEVPQNPGVEQVNEQGWAVGWDRWPAVSPEPRPPLSALRKGLVPGVAVMSE